MTTIQSIQFYTYKQLLYILIKLNIITYNQKIMDKRNQIQRECEVFASITALATIAIIAIMLFTIVN